MGKIEDDWMHPHMSHAYQSPPLKHGIYYVIERKKATPVSGNVSHVYSWEQWRSFDTKEARDAELERLRDTTMWQVRGRTHRYVHGKRIGADPFEHRDD